MSSCSVFVFMSLMEFAIVNNYMGPVATKIMKGYSDENIEQDAQTNGRSSKVLIHTPRSYAHHTLFIHNLLPTPLSYPIDNTYCDFFSMFTLPFCSENPSSIDRHYHHNTTHSATEELQRYILINFHDISFHRHLLF